MQTSQVPTTPTEPSQRANAPHIDDIYLKILDHEHERSKTRWTVSTFFMSVSFAVLGFSFQVGMSMSASTVLRIVGVLIYWFAFALFLHMYNYNKWLWSYLEMLEEKQQTNITIIRWFKQVSHKGNLRITSRPLLFAFGMLYTLGIGVIWLVGI